MRRQNLLCHKSATLLKNALSFFGQSLLQTSETVHFMPLTLESGIDVGQGIMEGPGKFVKNNKRRALNKCRA